MGAFNIFSLVVSVYVTVIIFHSVQRASRIIIVQKYFIFKLATRFGPSFCRNKKMMKITIDLS
jgi:hypothetical protein